MKKNPILQARSKHIELHHFIRNLVNDQEILIKFMNTKEQSADSFTKGVISEKFEQVRRSVTNYKLKGVLETNL